jgi:predicted esterase
MEPSLPGSTEPTSRVPLFWGHGQYDEIVLIEHQKAGIDYLMELGLISSSQGTELQTGVQSLQYPVGHSSDPNEMKAMADFIDRILFTDCDAATKKSFNAIGSKTDEL